MPIPVWRSLLFVPADNQSRIDKALSLGADAIILDLEDGVSAQAKPIARAALPAAIGALAGAGIGVVVRVNSGWQMVMADLDAAILSGVDAIMLPKVESRSRLDVVSEILAEWEEQRGLPAGQIGLIALIESPKGIMELADISKAERLIGIALGTEDFALEMSVSPVPDLLDRPSRDIALVSAAKGCMALAVPISIAEFRDVEAYRHAVLRGAAWGVNGAICIHPSQVAVVNDSLRPSEAMLDEARKIVAAWDACQAADGFVTALDGKMIDYPVAERAMRLLHRTKNTV